VERKRTMDAGRERIIVAACELLDADDESEAFSIDAVARRAGVARMTVYNQFESKAGLLEALFDSLAERGAIGQLSEVFREADPIVALDRFVALFGRFWTTNRRAHRRLRAAAVLDPELAAGLRSRNERRRHGATELVRRIGKDGAGREGGSAPFDHEDAVNLLCVLLAFDNFDALAGESRTPEDVTPMMQKLARLVVGVA
jgi:AcrR family transcriptional regulator